MQGDQRGSRNFICPMTEVACTDGRCRRDHCISEIEQDMYQRGARTARLPARAYQDIDDGTERED